jgi:simple sugar transport system permease protein
VSTPFVDERRQVDWRDTMQRIAAGGPLRTILAILLALAIGIIFIVFANPDVQATMGYLFAKPGDFFAAAGKAIGDAAAALFNGSIYNTKASDPAAGFRPLTETLRFAGPLIAAGLGVALTFRAGLFNIGGQGQMLMAAAWSSFAASQIHLPYGLHLIVAMLFGFVGAGLWGFIAGFLKAKTGAHEVIVTIMLNYIALSIVTYLMRTPILHDMDKGNNPQTLPPDVTAIFPLILGEDYQLRLSFILCILAVVVYWWIMKRSALGFRLRMVGLNPDAARAAGINVERTWIIAMVLSALFLGLAGLNQAIGRDGNFNQNVDEGIGFDGITVALLGNSSPIGVMFAGILFGAFKAASPAMQSADVSPEILGILQALIVLFIATPPLVRAIFRLPKQREVTDVATGQKPQPQLEQEGAP